jgi:hypothetical protein
MEGYDWDQPRKDPELDSLLKVGYSFQHTWFNGYVKYILFYKDVEVLTWKSDMGIVHDMVAIIKKYISDKREQKLNELGI